MNVAVISGGLTRDCEAKAVGGNTVVKFSVAVTERTKNSTGDWEQYPVYIDVEYWCKGQAGIAQYLRKGTRVEVRGKFWQDRWVDAQGAKRSRQYVKADAVELGPKPTSQNDRGHHDQHEEQDRPTSYGGSNLANFDDDVPF